MAFLVAFVVYWFTLCPTVGVGDSGELVAAAHRLGIPHPTGYPLWLLLTKAFTAIVPLGSIAWRANLLSALCAAGSSELLARALRRLGAGRIAAIGGGLSLAFLAPIWSEATVARTYPLAALFSAALLWCTARWVVERRGRWLVGHNVLLGFGLANHAMVVAHVPALLAVVAGRAPAELRRAKLWGAALLALVPGLLVYGYLPIRAAADPGLEYRVPMEPGGGAPWSGSGPKELHDLTRLAPLQAYLTRDFHQSHAWAKSAADHTTILGHHVKELGRELTAVGVVLALIGAWSLWRSGRSSVVVAVALLWLCNLAPLALHGAWWDLFLYPRYLTSGFVGVALLVGVGIDAAARAIAARAAVKPTEASGAKVARVAAACVALALPALLLVRNWRACDRSDGWLAVDYGRALLAELPKDAQFLSGSDSALYPLFALQFTEGARPDVQIVSPLQLPGDPEILKALRAARRGEPRPPFRPAFTPDVASNFEGLERDRRGLLYRLKLPGSADLERPPYSPPPIRGLDRDDEPDPFARSVIGAIEADLADAAAVRGDREQARARLSRVARLRCPRPWGNVTGILTLARLAEAERKAGRPDLAREELELARVLAAAALESGDPRDPDINEWLREIELQLR